MLKDIKKYKSFASLHQYLEDSIKEGDFTSPEMSEGRSLLNLLERIKKSGVTMAQLTEVPWSFLRIILPILRQEAKENNDERIREVILEAADRTKWRSRREFRRSLLGKYGSIRSTEVRYVEEPLEDGLVRLHLKIPKKTWLVMQRAATGTKFVKVKILADTK